MAKRKLSTFERLQPEGLNRQRRRELGRRITAGDPGLAVVHPDAAGIDVGNASHFVAIPPERDPVPIREFGSWTAAVQEMAQWVKAHGLRPGALQSTGVYWLAGQEVLEQAGLEGSLGNARGTKTLPGRKSDVQECEWLRKRHTSGLLRNSFRPPAEIRAVRTIWRQRARWVQEAGRMGPHRPKALTTMTGQLANTISDLSGVTGQAILRASVAGVRDPWALAKLRDPRIAASEAEIAHSWPGHWREEVLFELRQRLEAYAFYQQHLAACDRELAKATAAVASRELPATPEVPAGAAGLPAATPARRAKARRKHHPGVDLAGARHRTMGVDLTRIDGIDVLTAQVIFAELGPDFAAFPDEQHFASWLTLAPRHDISGGKVLRRIPAAGRNRVANALRMAAQSLSRSNSYLGARYRRLRARLDGPVAVKAMARSLACLVYRLGTKGQAYVDHGAAHYEAKRQQRERRALERRASNLGLKLLPAT